MTNKEFHHKQIKAMNNCDLTYCVDYNDKIHQCTYEECYRCIFFRKNIDCDMVRKAWENTPHERLFRYEVLDKHILESPRVELHKDICSELTELYRKKNKDYGDSFVQVREEYPEAICIRLSDKLNRLKSCMKSNEVKILTESIDDTLIDLANYCIMELIERRFTK